MANQLPTAVKVAFKRTTETASTDTYPVGTEETLGANHLLPIISENISLSNTYAKEYHKHGGAGIFDQTIARKVYRGTITCRAEYSESRALTELLACGLGLEQAGGFPVQSGSAYEHQFEPDDHLHTDYWMSGEAIAESAGLVAGEKKCRYGTLAVDRQIEIWEYSSVYVNKIVWNSSWAGTTITFDLIAYNVDRGSVVNTASTTWDYGTAGWASQVGFDDLVFRMDLYSGAAALSGADEHYPSAVTIIVDNQLDVSGDVNTSTSIAEPKRRGPQRVTGSFTFPLYDTDVFNEWQHAEGAAALMADLKWTGPIISGADNYYYEWYLPTVQFAGISTPVRQQLGPVTLNWEANIPTSAAAGFPTVMNSEKAVILKVQNPVSGNMLL